VVVKLLVKKGAKIESITSIKSLAINFLEYNNIITIVIRVTITL
jgi:hypothetical protein